MGTPDLSYEFTWEAATERFIKAAAITVSEAQERERLGMRKLDERIAWFHNELGKGSRGDNIRKVLGAGPVSDQVKYENQNIEQDAIAVDGDDSEGLPLKLKMSSLAQSIRASVVNI